MTGNRINTISGSNDDILKENIILGPSLNKTNSTKQFSTAPTIYATPTFYKKPFYQYINLIYIQNYFVLSSEIVLEVLNALKKHQTNNCDYVQFVYPLDSMPRKIFLIL